MSVTPSPGSPNRADEFDALYQHHSREIWALAYARWLNADTAMDIAQETYLRLWRAWEKGERILNARAWLLRVAKNLAEDYAKSSFRRNGTHPPQTMNGVQGHEPLPLERVSALLLSPYLATSSGERSARAEFDAFELRKVRIPRPEISLRGLVEMMDRSKRRSKFSQLLGTLRTMQRVAGRLQGLDARSHAEWAEKMRELLVTAAWGSERGETSVEFQMRSKWESALDELATLDFDGVPVDYE